MAQVSYYLLRPKEKETAVYGMVRYGGKSPFKFYPGVVVETAKWNDEKKIVKPTHEHAFEINKILKDLAEDVETIIIKAKANRITLDSDYLKRQLNKGAGKSGKTFEQVFNEFKESKKGNEEGTIKTYDKTINRLKDFCYESNEQLNFELFDEDFGYKFKNWMLSKNYIDSYIAKTIKILKGVLYFAADRGHINSNDFKNYSHASIENEVIFSPRSELNEIAKLELTDLKLRKSRASYLFQANCGMRISDLFRLNEDSIGEDHIKITTKKVKGRVVKIPLTPKISELIKELFGELKDVKLSEPEYRENIKTLYREAKINELITIERYSGNKRIETKEPKWKLVSSHTARRSFVTISVIEGMPDDIIMAVTGINSYKTLKRYKNITDDYVKDQMSKTWK